MSPCARHVVLEPPPGAARLILASLADRPALLVDLCGNVVEGRLGRMAVLDEVVFLPRDAAPPLPVEGPVYVEVLHGAQRTAFYTRALHCGPGTWVIETPVRIQCWEERRVA